MSNLCNYCRQIPFHLLICPTTTDIALAQDARKHNKKPQQFISRGEHSQTATVLDKAPLGSLSRMRQESSRCHLCRIFYNIIQRQGSVYMHDEPIPTDDRAMFYAEAKFSGFVTVSPLDGEGTWTECYYILRRLCLKGVFRDLETGQEDPYGFAHFPTVLQAYQPDVNKTPDDQKMLFAGRLRPKTIDLDLLRRWIAICDTEHENTCEREVDDSVVVLKNSTVKRIRLIDVHQNCLRVMENVDIAASISYTALSYVWGRNQTSRLLKENAEALAEEGSLSNYGLLQTLVDSIALTKALGIDYIWIDVLCIVQDDPTDISLQIGNVGQIYSNAQFTIIASGIDADAGLPGFRSGTRSFQQEHVEVIPGSSDDPGLSLLTTCKQQRTHWGDTAHYSEEEIDASKWNTRGWTLQERVLSKRSLVFTQEQVYWVCDGAVFCEESHFEHPDLPSMSFMDTPLRYEMFPMGPMSTLAMKSLDGPLTGYTNTSRIVWKKYGFLVRNHSARQLTNAGDIHGSFRAICDAFAGLTHDDFHWGHPCSRFESSLSWRSGYSTVGLRRRIERTTLKMTNLFEHVQLPSWSWMGWTGPVDFSVTDDKLEFEEPSITCYFHKSNPLRIVEVYSARESQATQQESKHVEPRVRQVVSLEDVQTHLSALTDERLSRIPDKHVLFFWTTMAYFNVEPQTRIRQYEGAHEYRGEGDDMDMKDEKGSVIGRLSKMGLQEGSSVRTDTSKEEFAMIGKRDVPGVEGSGQVIALQVRWVDGVAYRENIAEIEEEGWKKAHPIQKLIALQ